MPNDVELERYGSVAFWAKRLHIAGRNVIEATLRPYDLGATQWYVLHHLVQGPTMQRDLTRLLQVERATLSPIIAALVRKGFVEQVPDSIDQRQKLLRLTPAGTTFWAQLPDLMFIRTAAFGGIDDDELSTAIAVLRTATERLDDLAKRRTSS